MKRVYLYAIPAGLLVVLGIVAGVNYVQQPSVPATTPMPSLSSPTPHVSQPAQEIPFPDRSTWETYKSSKYEYVIQHPRLAEVDETNPSCVVIQYRAGHLNIRTTEEPGPCGPTGVGLGNIRTQSKILIGDTSYTATGFRYDVEEHYKQLSDQGLSEAKSAVHQKVLI